MNNRAVAARHIEALCRPKTYRTVQSVPIRRHLSSVIASTRPQAYPNFSPSQTFPLSRARASLQSLRFNSSLSIPENDSQNTSSTPEVKEPSYQLTFTCKPCRTKSSHFVTKHGYHKGTVLITCPGCKNRHVISDHLGIFMDNASTLEDILKRTAGTDTDITKLLKKGKLGMRPGQVIANESDTDLEFWDDGTTTTYQAPSSEPNAYDEQRKINETRPRHQRTT